jgi:hypothetical protein
VSEKQAEGEDPQHKAAALVQAIIEEGRYQVPDRVREVVVRAVLQDLIVMASPRDDRSTVRKT